MWLALLLLAAPVTDEVSGPPAALPRLPAPPPHATLPLDWYLEGGELRTTDASGPLFDDSAEGPRGAPAGTACLLTTPVSFPLAHAELRARDVTFHVLGGELFYVPVPLTRPVRVTVWRNNAAGKDPLGEVILGVLTLGFSTLRLAPSVATTVEAPARGRGRAGGFSVECRTVGRDSVERARSEKACTTLECLREQVALLGPHDAALLAQAQALVDERVRTAHEWRAAATWRLRGLEILSSARCGARCVKLTVQNFSAVPRRFPHVDTALDADGRRVWVSDDVFSELAPGETRVVKLSVAPAEAMAGSAPRFPVVLRLLADTWARAPGAFTEGGVEYRFGAPHCEEGKLTMPVTLRCFASSRARVADTLWLPSGASTSLHLPWCATPYVDAEAWAWVKDGQPCAASAVGGPTETSTFVLLP